MDRRRLPALLIAVAVLVVVVGGPARAQAQADDAAQSPGDLARARALFEEGVSFADQGHFAQAANRFRQTLALHSAPAVKFNLALALEKLGRHGEAAEMLEDVRDARHAPRSMRRTARRMLHHIEPHVGHLTVSYAGDLHGAEIVVDDRVIPAEKVGSPVAVDPGQRVVALRHGHQRFASELVDVEAGGHTSVTLHGRIPTATETARAAQPPPPPHPAPEAAIAPTHEETTGGRNVLHTWWFWTAAGAVAVGAIAVVAVASSSGGGGPMFVQGDLNPGVVQVNP